MTGTAEKQLLRRRMTDLRQALSDGERAELSGRVAGKLFSSGFLADAETVFAYCGVRGEVETMPLIRRLLNAGVRVALPRTSGGEMRFFYLSDPAELVPGAYNVPEPPDVFCADDDEHALMILPGLAFTREGMRLGYGASYYDRYLAAHPGHPTVALAYGFQIADRIPSDPWDVPLDAVITETEVIRHD